MSRVSLALFRGCVQTGFLTLFVGLVGCGAPDRNAVLIVVDTLRWDYLGSAGHEGGLSPALDKLAAEGVRFDRAYTTSPWTKPAIASLLTGLYPSAHKVRTMMKPLSQGATTLAEILRAEGHQTGAVVSHIVITKRWGSGFDQGFDVFREDTTEGTITTPRVTDAAIEILRDFRADGRPFFLLVHYFDPHYEYLAHGYGIAAQSAGRLDGSHGIQELRRMSDSLDEEELEFLRDRYAEEVRFTDAGIGRLLREIDALGAREDTAVFVTADHGEEFMERGWIGHTRTLYEELLRVPLIVRAPFVQNSAGRVVETPASTVSVAGTILELLGIDPGPYGMHGGTLVAALRGEAVSDGAVVFGEVDFLPQNPSHEPQRAFKKAAIGVRFKVIRDDETGRVEIYDLRKDPHEQRDLAPTSRPLRRRWVPVLEREIRRARVVPPTS